MANDIQAITGGLDDSKLRKSIQDMVQNIETETNKMTKMFESFSVSAIESLDRIGKKGGQGTSEALKGYAAYKKEIADVNDQLVKGKISINDQATAIDKLKTKYADVLSVASSVGQKLKGTNMGGLSESLTGKISKGNLTDTQVSNLNISQLTQAQSLVKDIIGAGDINVKQQQKLVDLNGTITAELKRQNQTTQERERIAKKAIEDESKKSKVLVVEPKQQEVLRGYAAYEQQLKSINSQFKKNKITVDEHVSAIDKLKTKYSDFLSVASGSGGKLLGANIGGLSKSDIAGIQNASISQSQISQYNIPQLNQAKTLINDIITSGTVNISQQQKLVDINAAINSELKKQTTTTAQQQKSADDLLAKNQKKLLSSQTTNLSVVGRMPENDQLQVIEKINRLKEVGSKIKTIDPTQEATLARVNQQVDKLEAKLNKLKQPTMKGALGMDESSISATTEKINALIRVRDRLTKSDANYNSNLRTVNNEISRLGKLNQEAASSGINLEKRNNTLATSFENLGRRVLFYASLGAITGFVRDLAEVRGEYELLERSLGAIIGDFSVGTKIFQEQQAQALKSPFTVIDLGNATKQLAAYGFAVDELVPVTKRLADISAGVGVEMSRVIYNIGQIKAKGILDARDLRDFGNAGINVTKALADMYSTMEQRTVSTGEVFDRVTQRMVSFEDVMSVMNKLTDEGGMFFNMQAIQAETLKGQLSNLKDAYNKMLNEIGSDNPGLLSGAVSSIRALYENWETVVMVVTELIAIYGAYKVTQLGANALLGAENVALQKNIIVGKQKVAADLMKEMSTRQLTVAEQELIRTQNVLTKSDIDSLIANKNLTAQQLLRLAALGRLTSVQKVAAIQSKILNTEQTAMLHNMTMGTRRAILFGNAMTSMGMAIKGAISAIVSWNTVFMIVLSLIPAIISKISEHNKLIKEAKEGYAKLNEEITNLSGSYEIEKQNGHLDNQKTKLEQLIKLANEKYQMDINIDVKTMSGEQVDAKFSQITDEIEKIVWGAKQIGVALAGEGGGESLKTFGDTMSDTFSEVKNRMNGLVGELVKNEGQLQSWHKEFIAAVSVGQQEGESAVDYIERINNEFKKVGANYGWSDKVIGKDAFNSAQKVAQSIHSYSVELDKAKSKMREVGEQAKESIGKNLSPEELYKAIQLHIKDESLKSEWNDQVKPWILDELKDAFNMRVNIVTQFTKPKETEKTWSERLLAEIGSNTTIKTPYKGQLTQVVKSSEDLADAIVKVSAAHKKAQDATKEVMKSPFATAAEIQAYKEQEAALLQLKNRIDGTPDENKNKSKAQDKQLEFIKEEITLINNLRKDYDDLTASGKSAADSTNFLRKQYAEAIAKINNTVKALKLKIPPFDISNFAGKTDAEISKALDGLMKSLSSSAAKKDLSVELAKLNISAEKYDYTKITDGLTKALSEIDEQFALGKEIEESETIGSAFMQMFNIPEEDIIRTSKDAIKRIQDEVTKAIVEFNKKGGTQLPTDFNVLTDKTSSISNLLGDDKSSNDLVKKIDDAKSKATSIAKSDVKETEKAYKDLLKKYSEFEYKRTEIAEQAAKDRLDFAKKFGGVEEIKVVDEKLKAISDLENQLASTGDSAERDTLATQLEAAKAEVTKLLVEMAKLKGIPISIPLTIDKKESADLAKLVYDDFINSDLWVESFENVSNLSTGAIQQMITQLEKLGIENRKAFKPKELKEYYDKLESLKKSLIEKNPFIGFAKNMKDALKDVVGKSDLDVYKKNNGLVGSDSKVREMAVDEAARLEQAITDERNKGNSASLETLDALKKQLEKQKEIVGNVDEETKKRYKLAGQITEFAGNVKDATSVIGDIGNTILGDKDTKGKEIFNDVLNSINGVATAAEGVGRVLANPADIGGYIQIVKGLWDATKTWLDNSNNEITRKVEESKETIDKLQKSYVGLERAVTKAIGSQEIAAQKALISAKKMELAELKKQLALEKSRKGKDKDTTRIAEIEAQIQSLNYEVADAIDNIANNLLGTDIKSAAEDFAGVWIDAFLAGEDAMQALENKFGDMIKNMIVKAIASEVIASKLQPLWDEIKNLYNDNVISPDEVSRLIAMSKNISGLINEDMTALKPLLDSLNTLYDDSSSKADKSTLQKGISGVTETTAGIIEGYMNSVRTEVIIHTTLFKEMIMKGDIQMTINSNQLLVLRDLFQVQKSILNLLSAWSASEKGIPSVTETTAGIIEGYINSVRTEVVIHTTLFKEMIMKGDIQMTINSNQLLVLRDSFQVQKSILNLLSAWSASESGGRGMRVYLQN